MATPTQAEAAALAVFTARNKNDDDDKSPSTSTRAGRTKKAAFSTEQVLNLPREIIIGGVPMFLKAFEVERVKSVQATIWGLPVIALSAALSCGSGIDPDVAFDLFCNMDPEAELLLAASNREAAYKHWRLIWRRFSLSYDVVLEAATEALQTMAVNADELPMSREEIEAALSSSSLLLTDLIELIQTLMDAAGGWPGDMRSRF